ncbi:hypothetical protein I3760_10G023900 [Carya illinoinensis]|nr:hypothetical protein I3760_10G023900 [Carya illinoinensis]
MMMMEVDILSKEIIRPSSPAVHHLKSTKLSLLDQLTPTTYAPLILFYPNKTHPHFTTPKNLSAHLKYSLSETLNRFYPFSGRNKNNFFIDHYDEGVPYNEARVRCRMFDFFQHPETESLNQFLPCHPFRKEPNPAEAAQFAVQVNIFDCGGIAIGLCMSHKIMDGATASAFLNSWAATAGTRPSKKLVQPDFSEASSPLRFPPQEDPLLLQSLASLVEGLWFNEGKYKTRRFVFGEKAISTLRAKAKSKRVDNPSRIESLSAFIAARTMATSSGFARPTILAQAVNIRRLTKPRFSDSSMGNLFLLAFAACDQNSDSVEMEIELPGLVAALREAVEKINGDYLRSMQGDEAFLANCEYLTKAAAMVFRPKECQDYFRFTSWIKFGFNELDFGWGKPIWVGVLGGVGPEFRKLTIFNQVRSGNGIEAWVTLDEKEIDILENDPEFLAFATPNPSV